ncbi:MAG: MBL fold metallo-hydrolase [Solirubrobacteraceae bacterium]|nr:MBL fold metallo-hydrolase [Solirubrobacteraceae bacterium]
MTIDGAWLLGSGGWIPTPQRQTCSALVRAGDGALLIDAGTGIGHLQRHPELLDGVTQLDLVLTHFHLDHVVGFAYLPATPRVFAPGQLHFGEPSEQLLTRLVGAPFLGGQAPWREVVEIETDMITTAVGEVRLRRQDRHACPTLGIRIGDDLAYCTDTAFDEGTAAFADGVRVLAHEGWWHEADPQHVDNHASGAEAAELARIAGVQELVLIHVHPLGDPAAVEADARAVFPSSRLGEDLLRIV